MPVRISTKESIIEAAFVLFSRDPSASLSEVAERAGVGRATLHRYFPGREDLLRTLTLVAIEEMEAAAEAAAVKAESATDMLRLTLQALIPLGDRHGFMAQEGLDVDADIVAEFNRLDRETSELVEAAKKEDLFDHSIPTEWITQVFNALLYAAWDSVKQGETTHTQASDLAWRTLTQGLGAKLK